MNKGRIRTWLGNWARRNIPRPPLWAFDQHTPIPLELRDIPSEALASPFPRIAIVTPAYNHCKYLGATIDSVLNQKYPALSYHVQDGGSKDGTIELLETYGNRLSWQSEVDGGQGNAINLGFKELGDQNDVMAYLNSDDTLTPGALEYVASVFQKHPDVDIVYGHRIFIDHVGNETGRAIMPPHDARALRYIGYVPQETMFWRQSVWNKIGPIDESFRFALDWDFMLRAQRAGFKMVRLPHFLGCFRVHPEQKTSAMLGVGIEEMQTIRLRENGHPLSLLDKVWVVSPFLLKQAIYQGLYRANVLRIDRS